MSIDEFNQNEKKYLNVLYEYQYIFELYKCCGYKEWITVYKKMTINDLYANLYRQLCAKEDRQPPLRLFLLDSSGVGSVKKIELERNNMPIYDYILANPTYFKPIYPMPCRIVYCLHFDDGCCHSDHSYVENKLHKQPCIIHTTIENNNSRYMS